jgi:hypothetical protein
VHAPCASVNLNEASRARLLRGQKLCKMATRGGSCRAGACETAAQKAVLFGKGVGDMVICRH